MPVRNEELDRFVFTIPNARSGTERTSHAQELEGRESDHGPRLIEATDCEGGHEPTS
jgi:hypothetical protein